MRKFCFSFLVLAVGFLAGCDQVPTVSPQVNSLPVNISAEVLRAKAENKLLLIEFGSSDACPPCMELEKKVFSKVEFSEYARSNLVFVRLDYPDKSKLPADVMATNLLLASQFNAYGFPTFVALNHEGKEMWRKEGVTAKQIDLKEFIALIESAKLQRK